MNKLEFLSMNNPIRGFIQDRIEVRKLRQLSQLEPGKTVLEIGCGNGYGTKLIKKYFKPKKIVAIDLDKRMIDIAKRENNDQTVTFEMGDAAKLDFPDNTFDAIFDFGIIHHIPNWKDCLQELKRVLKPNGELILEDLSIETFQTPVGKILKVLLDHPYDSMFQRKEFMEYLEQIGFKSHKTKIYYPLNTLKYFVIVAKNRVK